METQYIGRIVSRILLVNYKASTAVKSLTNQLLIYYYCSLIIIESDLLYIKKMSAQASGQGNINHSMSCLLLQFQQQEYVAMMWQKLVQFCLIKPFAFHTQIKNVRNNPSQGSCSLLFLRCLSSFYYLKKIFLLKKCFVRNLVLCDKCWKCGNLEMS